MSGVVQRSVEVAGGSDTLLAGGRRSGNSSLPGVSIAPRAECPRERPEARVELNPNKHQLDGRLHPLWVRRLLGRTS